MAAGPNRRTRWLAVLGPGILFASTAIGVSHLVQSTRAGAIAGFGLLWAVVAANLAKYPFFEFGSRYANATGESLVCLLYTSPSPRDGLLSRMPSSA